MMSDDPRHLPDETLIDYADDPASLSNRRAVEDHLASCAECRAKLDDFRVLASAMRDEETWWAAEEISDGGGLAIREFIARREAEDAEAERMLRPLLESSYRFSYANVARKKRFQTAGVVRLLCETTRHECDRDPRFALTLAETACFIADTLPDDDYPAAAVNELRGTAWKEYSTVCRHLQRFEAGYDALNRAERAYRRLADPGMQLATVELCRALLLWEQQRYDDALRSARSAAAQFAARRETERYFQAKEVEATILHRKGDVAAACETYSAAFELADSIGDPEMKARAARNLGIAYRDRGDIGEAGKYLLVALQLYEALEKHAMVVHTRWSIARLSLSAGNFIDAAQRLPALILELTRLGMRGDAASAQLDHAEALLILGRYEEVETACGDLFAFFRQAQMLTGAMTAAAYLKEAAASRKLTRRHFEQVRKYLEDLERSPELAFVPPPDPPHAA